MIATSFRRPRLLLAGAAATAFLLVGCGSGELTVKKADIADKIATQLAAQQNLPKPAVACPADLKGKVGATLDCTLKGQGETETYGVKVTVTSVEGTDVKFDIKVSDAPLDSSSSTTAP